MMEVNKLIFGGLSLGCLVAAGTGSYVAVRQNSSPPPAAISTVPEVAGETLGAVSASEGVITPAPAPVPQEPVSSESTRPTLVRSAPEPPPPPAATPPRTSPPDAQSRTARSNAPRPETRQARVEDAAPPRTAPSPTSATGNGSVWESRPSVAPDIPGRESPNGSPVDASAVDADRVEKSARSEATELVVPAESVLGLQIERTISSEYARVEDRVEARVTRDVRVGSRVAIPAGSLVQGSVTQVDTGGKVKERARLGVRFHTVVLADSTRVALRTDPVVREGTSPAGESAAKIGGAAAGGAILGAILGGSRGAAIGGAIGAAGGTAATMAGDRNPALLAQGSTVTVRILQPVTVTIEKD